MKMRHLSNIIFGAGVAAMAVAATPASAQNWTYDDPVADAAADEEVAGAARSSGRSGGERVRTSINPYVEATQVLGYDFSPFDEAFTYSTIAAGVDATIATRSLEGQVSARYERRIAWDDDSVEGDTLSGLARLSGVIVPGAMTLEAGGIATRTRTDIRGDAPGNILAGRDNITQVYSVYGGPSVSTNVGDFAVGASYRLGYTRAENPNSIVLAPGEAPIDAFDDSTSQAVAASIGQRPGGALPFGWTVSSGYNREDMSQLDQRIEDASVRADVTVPVSSDLALVAGVGYEDVEVSGRDAVRDVNGLPVTGRDGRYITDRSRPRQLAYDESGLIWDAGVLWRPSARTSLAAHVGRRYGSTTYYGSFAYAPSDRLSMNISAYDTLGGFGGLLTESLSGLPTTFDTSRNPISGELNGCVFGRERAVCFNDPLQSLSSAAFRSRGVAASLSTTLGANWNTGLGVGYNRRKFIGAPGTILALANGTVDENWYAAWSLNGQLDERSSVAANAFASLYEGGTGIASDVKAYGANASYLRNLTRKLSATAALGIDGYDRDGFDAEWTASALLGLRYDF